MNPAEVIPRSTIRAFIFARGGSKGVPRKNVQPVGGRPLIAHAIATALACRALGQVLVSTDDDEIATVARAHGADVPFLRPAELASDHASEWLAWRHAIDWVERNEGAFSLFVSLPATSPFRSVDDVERCIALLENSPELDIVVTVKKAERSPYFNMLKRDEHGHARLVISDGDQVLRRQDAPDVFDMTTVAYVARTGFIKDRAGVFDGTVGFIEIPAERAIDIDTPFDLRVAQLLAAETGVPRPSTGT